LQNILLPPKTVARLEPLINQRQMVQAQIDAIVFTARDLLDVPDDYVINDIRLGFVPPADYIEVPDNQV
jgi:hypothetical protein